MATGRKYMPSPREALPARASDVSVTFAGLGTKSAQKRVPGANDTRKCDIRVAVRVVAAAALPVLDIIVVGDCDTGPGATTQTRNNGAKGKVAFSLRRSKVQADGRRPGRGSRRLRNIAA